MIRLTSLSRLTVPAPLILRPLDIHTGSAVPSQ